MKRTRIRIGVVPVALALTLATVLTHARGDEGEYRYEGYGQYSRVQPFRDDLYSPYLEDPVNHRSSLTPEPVWRSMFRSTPERIINEEREFGVGGESQRELHYWQTYRR